MTRLGLLFLFLPALTGCGVVSFGLDDPAGSDGIEKTTVVSHTPFLDSATVIAGPEYAAGGLHRFVWGDHYRDEWTSPFTVQVLDLVTFADGLTPVKRGGGFQTMSLRFKGKNGRFYAFRSINKDPAKALPPELRQTFAGGVLKDQISSSHPAGALVVDVLADTLGVLHPEPILCILPDDDRLGEFRSDFAGLLGTLEDYPADGEDGTAGFAGSTKIVSTLKLFDELDKNSENRVNAMAFLTARLLDVFVGDWDRHIDQWRWARFEKGGRDVWHPIPRDRDQAFAHLDGVIPWIGMNAITQVEAFDDDFPKIADLTYSGRFLDRRLLVDLDWRTWDSVTSVVISKLTDDILTRALDRIPAAMRSNSAWILSSLKARRAKLADASREFYLDIAGDVDIRLSDKAEFAIIERMDDQHTRVTVARRDKATGESKGPPVYSRIFSNDETDEIRVYLLDGDDKVTVSGEVQCGTIVRVVGGKGDDELRDDSIVHGRFLGIFPKVSTRTYFYDDAGKNVFIPGRGTAVNTDKYENTLLATEQY
ncbi:MAG: hypothetical protein ACKVRP_06205 [Bacteroidota bacterium]